MTIYNPHQLPRQALIDTFVARQPLLEELLADLRRGGAQHHLLIGDRGAGKTTLLLRLAAAIEDDKKLAKRCIALRFPEEQYNVARLSDFWMNALDALIDALARHGDTEQSQRLEQVVTELESFEEQARSTRALDALKTWSKQHKRLIVLLVDNLDLILDRLSDSHWELREILSADNGLVVIGASARFLQETADYQSAFYDFFHVHQLGPLPEHEARQLVLALARRANLPQVERSLDEDPGRFKALYALTGGTPRTLALLHTVLVLGQNERIEQDLDGLLDQLTPYYKARFDDLPSQSQIVVNAVALHWHPITAADCQKATNLDVNVVSAQLSRLTKSGLLAKVELPSPSKLGFQVSERFFNIWYLMRASRRLRRRLAWFVEFLRIFYGEEDLRRRANELLQRAPAEALSTPAKCLAFASAVPDPSLRRQLEFRAISLLIPEGMSALREQLDLEGEDRHLQPVVNRAKAMADLHAQIDAAPASPGLRTRQAQAWVIVQSAFLPLLMKQQLVPLALHGGADDAIGATNKLHKLLLDTSQLTRSITRGELPSFGDLETASDLTQILETMPGYITIAAGLMSFSRMRTKPIPDEFVEAIVRFDSKLAALLIELVATSFIRQGQWSWARSIAARLLPQFSTEDELSATVHLFRAYIVANRANEALELLEQSGTADRWLPLREALIAVTEGDERRLSALAPEVREPSAQIYRQLTATSTDKAALAAVPASADIARRQRPSSPRQSSPGAPAKAKRRSAFVRSRS